MAFYSIVSIIGVVICVLGTIQLNGWYFGVMESINSIIIIGLSVDYVVHLCNSYVENKEETRYKKVKFALK